jgi:hypothetical protein
MLHGRQSHRLHRPRHKTARKLGAVVAGIFGFSSLTSVQQPCPAGVRIEGRLTDPTGR